MKVIAKIDGDRVLCEVNVDEVALLNGFKTRYSDGFGSGNYLSVGSEFNLEKLVATSQFVRSMRPQILKQAKNELEGAIRQIDEAADIVSKLEIFNTLKEEETF